MSRAATNVSVSDRGSTFLAVAVNLLATHPARAVLAADDIVERVGCVPIARSTLTFSSRSVGLERGRWLHRDEADELQEMVLENVADRAGLLVERSAVLDADRLGHRDLHVVHVAPVPERLEDAVPEAEDQQVADRLLPEVVVDAVDL